jgi:DNA-binding transcriptional MerR regulator
VEKASDAFRTISEAAEDLDLPQHVLRFWETKFNQIRPMKRGGGRRYYRPDDIELLRGIQYLLYGEGYTIKGVQRILKEQGVRFVMEIWRHPGEPIPVGAVDGEDEADSTEMLEDVDETAEEAQPEPVSAPPPSASRVEPRFGTTPGTASAHASQTGATVTHDSAVDLDEPLPSGILPDDAAPRAGFRFMDRFRAPTPTIETGHAAGALSKEDIRRLQATLFELLECKRLLDQTR